MNRIYLIFISFFCVFYVQSVTAQSSVTQPVGFKGQLLKGEHIKTPNRKLVKAIPVSVEVHENLTSDQIVDKPQKKKVIKPSKYAIKKEDE